MTSLYHRPGAVLKTSSWESIHEIAVLRLLAYTNRLIGSQIPCATHHVQYNNTHCRDPNTPGTVTHALANHADRGGLLDATNTWLNNHQNRVDYMSHNLSNYLCLRHHYVTAGDYEESYTRLWANISLHDNPLTSTLAEKYTFGLHAGHPRCCSIWPSSWMVLFVFVA